jgi:hypothetical protein
MIPRIPSFLAAILCFAASIPGVANELKTFQLSQRSRSLKRSCWTAFSTIPCGRTSPWRRTEEGWTAEMEIPFSTLRFSPGKEAWGMNVRRLVRRKGEEPYWAPLPLEADITRVSLAGQAKGRADGVQTESNNGVDVKWGVGRGLSLDLTVNTDFAESEADEQQVNLSRFSLFLLERREFFLRRTVRRPPGQDSRQTQRGLKGSLQGSVGLYSQEHVKELQVQSGPRP